MSDSARSLKDIYGTANATFEDMTRKLIQSFTQAVDSALSAYSEQEREAQNRLFSAGDANEAEIIEYLTQSKHAIKESIELTMVENEQFLVHLKQDLTLKCRGLQQEISDVSESLLRLHLISAKAQQASLSDKCDSEVNRLKQAAVKANNTLREQSYSVGTKFGEALIKRQTQLLMELMGAESSARQQIPESLAGSILKSNVKESELRSLHKQQLDQLDARLPQLARAVERFADDEIVHIESASDNCEKELRAVYDELTAQVFSSNDQFTKNFYAELEELSKNSKKETAKLSLDLVKQLESIVADLQADEEKEFDRFRNRSEQLSADLQNLIEDQRLISGQPTVVVDQILEELKGLEANFERRMGAMMVKQIARVEEKREVAVDEVVGAFKSLKAKMIYLSTSFTKQVQEKEAQVLKVVEDRLERAKRLINEAAGEEVT